MYPDADTCVYGVGLIASPKPPPLVKDSFLKKKVRGFFLVIHQEISSSIAAIN